MCQTVLCKKSQVLLHSGHQLLQLLTMPLHSLEH